jgi:DNA uptake protein ComE-like DNA-binding protein
LLLLLAALGTPGFAREEPNPPPPFTPEPASEAPAPPAEPKPKLIDINTASVDQLLTLGLDERLAQKIIAGRPYRSRVDLKSRNVIPEKTFYRIIDRIVAKSPKLAEK